MGSACSGGDSKAVSPSSKSKRSSAKEKSSKDDSSSKGKKKNHSEKERDAIIAKATSMEDFSVMNTLGTGSYGAVKLARHKQTDHMVALKVTHKNHAAKHNGTAAHPVESAAWKELQNVRSPFVVRYFNTFMADPNIIVCMELCEGGDLNIHLELLGSFSPGDSKFYIAEICLGLAALHAQNIIYHDLKPQNMMLSKSGHVRLIDFGLAAVKTPGVRNCCTDMCGAPSYMSPEMFAGLGHDEMTDWWAVGITYYEFLTGDRPFCGSTFDGLGQSVCSEEVSWDPNIARETKDFIGKLLCKDPGNRMGARGGIDAIKKHPNFASLKWDDIKSCRKPGPKRTEKASLKGTGGSSMSRMDQAMMAARGGKQKGHERRFTISESSKPTNHAPDPSKKGNISGVSREQAFADARDRAAKRKSAQF